MTSSNKRVLLLGGTGAMGVYLAPKLVNLGFEVYITSRSAKESSEPKIHYIQGNAKDWDFLSDILLDNYDAVVDFMVYQTSEFAERYEKLLDSTKHYLFLSSYRVYGDNKGNPISETSPRLLDSVQDPKYLATDEYGLTKARQENLLVGSDRKNWTILRPAITYSKTRFQLGTMEANEFLYRGLQKKKIIFPKQMLQKEATMSWAGDVAEMIARVVLNEKAMGEIFTVSTGEHHKWEEIMNYYVDILGLKVTIVDLEDYKRIIGRPWQIKYDRMLDRVIDNSKILSVTGMKAEDLMPLYEGLRIELAGFVKDPSYGPINQERERMIDEITTSKYDESFSKFRTLASKIKRAGGKVKRLLFSKDLTLRQKVSKILNHWRLRGLKNLLKRIRNVPLYMKRHFFYDGAIVTLTGNYNYGSAMQRLALQTVLKQNGLKFKVFDFDFMLGMSKRTGDRTEVEKFTDKYLDKDKFNRNSARFYKSYVVGSDQVWRDFFNGDWSKFGVFFLDFVKDKQVKRVGYAISFGGSTFEEAKINEKNRRKVEELVQKFDAVSVREESGIKLVEELGKPAKLVLDPTMLLTAKDYSKIIEESEYKNEKTAPLFYYILDNNEFKSSIIHKYEEHYSFKLGGIFPNNGKPLKSPVLWLKGFRDAELAITDSFHGMVFSIINHTPFLVFLNKNRGIARMVDLLTYLGLQDRIVYQDENTDEILPMDNIDWEAVDAKLASLRKESIDWLISSLK